MLHHVFPQHANPAGTLYGGWMMNWIVTAGNLAASRLTKKPLLLASIEDLFFLQPVRIGDVVTVKAMVEYVEKKRWAEAEERKQHRMQRLKELQAIGLKEY